MKPRLTIYILLAFAYLLFFIDRTGLLPTVIKALPVSWLALWAYQHLRSQPQLFIALALGACGDILMALDLFIAGLASFLAGHLAYIALWLTARKPAHWPALLPIGVIMLAACWYILPGAVGMQLPVAVYFFVIALMAALATCTRWLDVWGIFGVYCFLISDFIIGWNRFVEPLDWSRLAIMTTYYAAQGLIASSVIKTWAKGKAQA